MAQYLVAIHHPDGYDGSLEDEAMHRDIHALNREMVAAGVRVFVAGLAPASSAKSLRAKPDGKVLITDGPYLETKEHTGGFWVLEAADINEALAWGRKAAVACRAPVEVRALLLKPPANKLKSRTQAGINEKARHSAQTTGCVFDIRLPAGLKELMKASEQRLRQNAAS